MNSLDVVLILILVAYAVSGYLQGFVTNLVATLGLLVGGLIAIAVVPWALGSHKPTLGTSLLALGGVVACAAIGQALGTYVGSAIRDAVTWRPLRSLDALGGSVLSVVAVLCAAWALGYAVTGTRIPYVSDAVRGSAILGKVNRVMPPQAGEALGAFNRVLDTNLFPRYIDPFANERITAVAPPDPATLRSAGVMAAERSVVKVLGAASCNRGIEGSGFVYATDRVMTNAHVVAGVAHPYVLVGDRRLAADVVLFDPRIDLAVLAVDRLGLTPLAFDTSGRAGDKAAVLGYPENGPFDARAARIRAEQRLRSPDIYDRGQVVRKTFAIRSLVRSGNSGGPLVSDAGTVFGIVFAASVSDSSTGYAITAAQAATDATRGRTASSSVSTGKCA